MKPLTNRNWNFINISLSKKKKSTFTNSKKAATNTSMKLYPLILIILIATIARAQENVVYYTSNWQETTKDKAYYYTIATQEGTVYKIEDYFLNGKLRRTGYSTSREGNNPKARFGHSISYDSFGFKTSEGDFKNGRMVGHYKQYFKSSNSINFEEVANDSQTLYRITYDSVNQKVTSKSFFMDGKFSTKWQFASTDSFLVEQNTYSEDKKLKTSVIYYPNHIIRSKKEFNDGKLVSQNCFDAIGKSITCDTSEMNKPIIYTFVEQMPLSAYNIKEYLATNLKYPKEARKNNIEGRVVIKFIVNEDGTISDAQIAKGIGGGCDEEALRVVSEMPPWKPGRQNGKSVSVTFTLPIVFKLQHD